MKIIITGSEGFLGSHLVPLLKEHTIWRWDHKTGHNIFDDDFEKRMKWADVVIHLVALTSVGNSFGKEKDYINLNVLGTARVLQLALKYNVKVIFVSSGAIYQRNLSPYALSKAMADDLCSSLQPYHPITILRPFNIFGIGMNYKQESLVQNFVEGAKKGLITINGTGEQTRDFINVRDVALIIKAAIDPKWDSKTVDVATGEVVTINYVAELFANLTGCKIKYGKPVKEIKWSLANTQMLKNLYKKKLTTNLGKDIEEIWRYYETD